MDNKLTEIKKRVIQYIEYKDFTKVSFYENTNISASNFKGKARSSELGGEKIVSILSFYKDINPYWLLLGEGEMEVNTTHSTSKMTSNNIEDILALRIVSLIKPMFKEIKGDIKVLTKNLGEMRLDLDDMKDETDSKYKKD